MKTEEVWLLLQEGCNVAEIAAAARVSEDVARSMVDEAMGRTRGTTLRRIDRAAMVNRQALAMAGQVVSL